MSDHAERIADQVSLLVLNAVIEGMPGSDSERARTERRLAERDLIANLRAALPGEQHKEQTPGATTLTCLLLDILSALDGGDGAVLQAAVKYRDALRLSVPTKCDEGDASLTDAIARLSALPGGSEAERHHLEQLTCAVCGTPWPCSYSGHPYVGHPAASPSPAPVDPEAEHEFEAIGGDCLTCGRGWTQHPDKSPAPVEPEHSCGDDCSHASDCDVHNEPAEPAGTCSCSPAPVEEREGIRWEARRNPNPEPGEGRGWTPWEVFAPAIAISPESAICGCWWKGAAHKIAAALNREDGETPDRKLFREYAVLVGRLFSVFDCHGQWPEAGDELLRRVRALKDGEREAEPVAWLWSHPDHSTRNLATSEGSIPLDARRIQPLYAAPPAVSPGVSEEVREAAEAALQLIDSWLNLRLVHLPAELAPVVDQLRAALDRHPSEPSPAPALDGVVQDTLRSLSRAVDKAWTALDRHGERDACIHLNVNFGRHVRALGALERKAGEVDRG